MLFYRISRPSMKTFLLERYDFAGLERRVVQSQQERLLLAKSFADGAPYPMGSCSAGVSFRKDQED
ncbi:hypothetical protein N6H14_31905 [Paenibacillus sp. CC-CFT747]|nr:hypothetical protein N6H14_31905 [Paenibacillus sp. CC-CFT747]